MKSENADRADLGRRAVGRPRALTLDEILDRAIALGLASISMPALAAQLGIGTATLYNYVANRDELLRLAALKQAGSVKLDDSGQDWRGLVHAHAQRFFGFFASEPQLMIQYMDGAIGLEVLLDYVEAFLGAMARRGVGANDAYRLFTAVNTIVLGAVVRQAYLASQARKGLGQGELVRRKLREADPQVFPNLRACTDLADGEQPYDFGEALDCVLDSFSKSLFREGALSDGHTG